MNLSVSSTPPKNCLIIAYFDKANPYELTDSVGAFKKKGHKMHPLCGFFRGAFAV